MPIVALIVIVETQHKISKKSQDQLHVRRANRIVRNGSHDIGNAAFDKKKTYMIPNVVLDRVVAIKLQTCKAKNVTIHIVSCQRIRFTSQESSEDSDEPAFPTYKRNVV